MREDIFYHKNNFGETILFDLLHPSDTGLHGEHFKEVLDKYPKFKEHLHDKNKNNFIISISKNKITIFYFFKIQNQQNLSAETGVLRCYGRQRATNLYYSGSREQIVNERRRD